MLLVGDDSWPETGITWNNRPAGSTVLATVSGSAIQVGQPLEIDVTSTAQQEQAGDGKLSLAVVSTVEGTQRYVVFGSRESSVPPVLHLSLSGTAVENQPPQIDAGPDQAVVLPAGAALVGVARPGSDGLLNNLTNSHVARG